MGEVIGRIDDLVADCRRRGSRIGYFAALYHHVTTALRTCIHRGDFDDAKRMERLAVVFFNRYLAAVDELRAGQAPSGVWAVAFEAAESSHPIVLQHLLLGMNAHINYDLGVAVATVCDAAELPGLRKDFERMNAVLASLLGDIEHDLTEIWPLLGVVHKLAGDLEDGIINFSMREAREYAWNLATTLAALPARRRAQKMAAVDREMTELGRLIYRPGLPLSLLIKLARLSDPYDVPQTIDILLQDAGPGRDAPHPPVRSSRRPKRRDPRRPRTKVAILGGGVGAMSTAFELTNPLNPRHEEYDVTVYQMGWRLGGKGASGRAADHCERIEEHGLHIWFGSYDNAFRLMRQCYAELGRAPDAPLASIDTAFRPHSFIVLEERFDQRWIHWPGALPTNDLTPGDEALLLPLWDYVVMAVDLLYETLVESKHLPNPSGDVDVHPAQGVAAWLDEVASEIETAALSLGVRLLQAARKVARGIDRGAGLLVDALDLFIRWAWHHLEPKVKTDTDARREWILLNFFYANIRAAVAEDVVERGLNVLNEYDYRELLLKYGYDDGGLMASSAWVLGIYDGVFAFERGDNTTPTGEPFPPCAKVEAGNVMRAGIRQFFAYKGASLWKMQAGMGDTVFAPLYEVLERRGVKFEFFHRVERLQPSADGKSIDTIQIERQVDLTPAQRDLGGYAPLVDVKGLPCWPNQPRWDQIVDGERLRTEGVDLESYATPTRPNAQVTLQAGTDFDIVVLGISLGALPYLCGDLIQRSTKWKAMVDHMQTIRTVGLQLWLTRTAYELGWKPMQAPILTCYDVSPLNTWGDMSHLADREGWPAHAYPLSVAYFCGPMRDDAIRLGPNGPIEDAHQLDQKAQNEKAMAIGLDFVGSKLGVLFPDAVDAGGTLRWDLLVDPAGASGAARLQSQYWKANVQPSERYVLSVPGSSKYRLKANDPKEFANLYLAGDWTDNGFNLGCVEAASMSGMLASNALSGYPLRQSIVGLEI